MADPTQQPDTERAASLERMHVGALVFQRAPERLDELVIHPTTAASQTKAPAGSRITAPVPASMGETLFASAAQRPAENRARNRERLASVRDLLRCLLARAAATGSAATAIAGGGAMNVAAERTAAVVMASADARHGWWQPSRLTRR